MSGKSRLFAGLLGLLLTSPDALMAQSTQCPIQPTSASPAPVLSTSAGPAITLNTLWEIAFGADYATTADPAERDAHLPALGLFYVPGTTVIGNSNGTPIADVQPLYRLLNSSDTDHMDSLVSGEGGYGTEGVLAYPWLNQTDQVGLAPITRMYDSEPGTVNYGDHRTAVQVSPVPHPESVPYYHVEGPVGYGYARFPGTDYVLAGQSAGDVTVYTNQAVGCAVWEWWWNGIEFVNDYDYGRQMQISLYPADGNSALGEAGDYYGGPGILVDNRHPSPCISYSVGSSAAGPFQTTSTVPLEYFPQCYPNQGAGTDNPIIYPSVQLGKTVTLDWIGPDNIDRNWPVAVFQTTINSPAISTAAVEAPTGYLTSEFNTYYYYNPASQALTQVSVGDIRPLSTGNGYPVPLAATSPQAVILASGTSLDSPAMGVYINDLNSGFLFYDNTSGDDGGESGSSFVKWEVHYYSGIPAGGWNYKTWVMTDTVQNVVSYMNQLYTWGVSSR